MNVTCESYLIPDTLMLPDVLLSFSFLLYCYVLVILYLSATFWTLSLCIGDLFFSYVNVGNMCPLLVWWHRSLIVNLVPCKLVFAWLWNWWKSSIGLFLLDSQLLQLWSVGWANYLIFGRNLTLSLVCFVGMSEIREFVPFFLPRSLGYIYVFFFLEHLMSTANEPILLYIGS